MGNCSECGLLIHGFQETAIQTHRNLRNSWTFHISGDLFRFFLYNGSLSQWLPFCPRYRMDLTGIVVLITISYFAGIVRRLSRRQSPHFWKEKQQNYGRFHFQNYTNTSFAKIAPTRPKIAGTPCQPHESLEIDHLGILREGARLLEVYRLKLGNPQIGWFTKNEEDVWFHVPQNVISQVQKIIWGYWSLLNPPPSLCWGSGFPVLSRLAPRRRV